MTSTPRVVWGHLLPASWKRPWHHPILLRGMTSSTLISATDKKNWQKKTQSAGWFLPGTYESCYAFWTSKNCDLNFLRGLAPAGFLDGFSIGRYEKKRKSFDFFAEKFWKLRNFLAENLSGTRAFSKHGFCPFPSIIRNSNWRIQNPSKSLKNPLLRQKDDYKPQVR